MTEKKKPVGKKPAKGGKKPGARAAKVQDPGKKKKPGKKPRAVAGESAEVREKFAGAVTTLPDTAVPGEAAAVTSPVPDAATAPVKKTPNLLEALEKEAEGGDNGEEEHVDPVALERGDQPMTLVGHLHEMRSRLLITLVVIIILMIAGFSLSDYIMAAVNKPFLATGQKLNLFKLFEGFTLRLKASLFASLLLSLPLIVYQIWRYISPAINRNDRTFIRIVLFFAILLFYGGIVFTYFFIPFAITALLAFAPHDMLITNNATEYFSFFVTTCVIMGAVFELPIVMLVLTKMGIVSPAFLIGKRKYAIVIIWIVAAIASPGPDPLSQAILAIPLMLLYEISIVISKLILRRKKKKELAEEAEMA